MNDLSLVLNASGQVEVRQEAVVLQTLSSVDGDLIITKKRVGVNYRYEVSPLVANILV